MTHSTVPEPLFLDFEASSFDGHPIEVAVSTWDGEIGSWLIRPAPGWTDWSPKAEAVHGISREMLSRDGIGVCEVARQLNLVLAGKVARSDAPEFDGWWYRQLFEAAGEEMLFSIGHAASVIPDVPGRNGAIEREAPRRAGPAHRAARDGAFLVELYRLATAAARKQKDRSQPKLPSFELRTTEEGRVSDLSGEIPQIFILKTPDGGETVLARTVINNPGERVFVGAILFFHDHGGLHHAWEVVDIASRADADGGGYVVSVEFLGSVE